MTPETKAKIRSGFAIQGVPEATTEKIIAHLEDDPEPYHCWEQMTLKAVNSGKKLGAKAITERVRWEAEIEKKGEFKVSNSFTAYYVRIFGMRYPGLSDYFDTKQLKGLSGD